MTDNPFDRETYSSDHPDCIVLGRFIGWKLDLDYDDDDYELKYVIQRLGCTNKPLEITGQRVVLTDGSYWIFELSTATSSGNAWTDRFSEGSDCRWDLVLRQTAAPNNEAVIGTGFISIFPSNSDRRSHAEIMLAKINSILSGRADDDVSSYSIKSRSISRMGIDELMKWRDYYVNEVERTGGTVNDGRRRTRNKTIRVRFE